MLAIDESTAENAGQITLDALWVDVNDTTTLRDNIGNDARGYSVGMGVGTDAGSGPRKNAIQDRKSTRLNSSHSSPSRMPSSA